MNQIELFYKIYNNEISEDDVIVIHTKFGHEKDQYILNDGFYYWDVNGIKTLSFDVNRIKTLSFFDKTNDEKYVYDIISREKYEKIIEKKEKEEEIFRLEQKLMKLKEEN